MIPGGNRDGWLGHSAAVPQQWNVLGLRCAGATSHPVPGITQRHLARTSHQWEIGTTVCHCFAEAVPIETGASLLGLCQAVAHCREKCGLAPLGSRGALRREGRCDYNGPSSRKGKVRVFGQRALRLMCRRRLSVPSIALVALCASILSGEAVLPGAAVLQPFANMHAAPTSEHRELEGIAGDR